MNNMSTCDSTTMSERSYDRAARDPENVLRAARQRAALQEGAHVTYGARGL